MEIESPGLIKFTSTSPIITAITVVNIYVIIVLPPIFESLDISFKSETPLIREAKKIEPINDGTLADLAASYQEAIIDCIKIKSEKAIRKILRENENTEIQYFVASGGVASNKAIRDSLTVLANKHEMKFIAPPMKFCTDNAAMIAWVGGLRLLRGQKDKLNIPARARWSLEEMRI